MFIKYYIKHKLRQMRYQHQREVIMTATIAAVAGVAVGLAAGVLFAPKSGKETREEIAKNAGKAAETVKNAAGNVKETVISKEEQLEKNLKDKMDKAKGMLNKTMNTAVEAADDLEDKAKSKIADAAGAVEEKAAQVKSDYED